MSRTRAIRDTLRVVFEDARANNVSTEHAARRLAFRRARPALSPLSDASLALPEGTDRSDRDYCEPAAVA